jgi:hypothetical protein
MQNQFDFGHRKLSSLKKAASHLRIASSRRVERIKNVLRQSAHRGALFVYFYFLSLSLGEGAAVSCVRALGSR